MQLVFLLIYCKISKNIIKILYEHYKKKIELKCNYYITIWMNLLYCYILYEFFYLYLLFIYYIFFKIILIKMYVNKIIQKH